MKKFWRKNSIWVSVLGFIIIAVMLFVFAALPLVDKIKTTSDAIEKKELDNEIDQQRMQQLPAIEKNYALFQSKENDLNVLLDSDDAVDFIKAMETLAQNTGNAIQFQVNDQSNSAGDSSTSNAIPKDDIRNKLPYANYLSLQITLQGDYPSFVKFLTKLENSDYYTDVFSINMTKNNASNDAAQASGNFDPFAAASVSAASKNDNAQVFELSTIINVAVYIKNDSD